MQSQLLNASRKQIFAFSSPFWRPGVASTSRSISTIPLRTARSSIYSPLHGSLRPFDEAFRISPQRNYWWSSKSSTESPNTTNEAISQPASALPGEASKPLENASNAQAALKDHTSAASNTSSNAPQGASSVVNVTPPSEPASAAANISSSPAEALSDAPIESIDSAITQFAALASSDYSHLFSWVWPPGLFLRTYSFLTEYVHITSPVIGLAVAFIALRIWLSPMQLRAQKAQARFAPYQEEWFAIQEKYRKATAEGDKLKAAVLAKRMMEIKEATDLKPLAPILPGVGMAALGIGGFVGAGRLVKYHKEVVEMGGAGPLSYPGGLFGTGIFEDLTAFSPTLLVVMTAMTWLSTRRGALDAAAYSKWMARMPWLITPPAFVLGYIAQFSSAQMILATTSIGYNVLQSYLLRVPAIRSAVGMQGVKVHDPKEFDFPPFISAWKDTWNDWKDSRIKKIQEAQEEARRNAERREMTLRSLARREAAAGLDKSTLRVKDAPTGSLSTPLPPRDLYENADDSSASTLPPEMAGPPKPSQVSKKTKAPKKVKA